jgi:hypothetical protein
MEDRGMIGMATMFIAEVAFILHGLMFHWESLRGDEESRLEALNSLTKASAIYLGAVGASILIVNELIPGSPFKGL